MTDMHVKEINYNPVLKLEQVITCLLLMVKWKGLISPGINKNVS